VEGNIRWERGTRALVDVDDLVLGSVSPEIK
jgi:hypothetical protein